MSRDSSTNLRLDDDESVEYPGEMSWAMAMLQWKTVIILGIYGILLKKIGTEYTVTNRRVYRRYGILSKDTSVARHDVITDVRVSQSLIARLVGSGMVKFNTAGADSYEITFGGVTSPESVRSKFRELKRSTNDRSAFKTSRGPRGMENPAQC
ncbi:MAG: PH domain-containing protein [Halobacteria archaeon]